MHEVEVDRRRAQEEDMDLCGALRHEPDTAHEGQASRPDTHVCRLRHMQGVHDVHTLFTTPCIRIRYYQITVKYIQISLLLNFKLHSRIMR